jgi:hypothetical protein
MPKPNKRDAFVRLAEHRVSMTIHYLGLLGKLASSNDFSPSDADKIKTAIRTELKKTIKRFEEPDEERKSFSFKEDIK